MASADIMYVLLFISLYFEVFMLVSFLEHRDRQRAAKPALIEKNDLPRVAIIVPCKNEEKSLSSTMASLLQLQYPDEKLEIIVVDDGSTDRTLEIARTYENDQRVRVFHKENGGKHSAMNLGLANTSAELIGCLDADSVVDAQALLRIVPVFNNPKVGAVTPGIHAKKPQTMLQHMQSAEYRLSIFNRFMLSSLGSAFIAPGPFSIFRAQTVRELGGWRYGHSTEDMEMALRMQHAGYFIANAPQAIVHTSTPRTLRGLFRQRVRWTYGFLRNAIDYRSMIGNKSYGNLGIIILPTALASIGIAIYFFVRIVFYAMQDILHEIVRIEVTGTLPHPSFSTFYINTSMLWFLIYIAVTLVLGLIYTGSRIGTKKHTVPIGTPLFILFYSFLVPVWLGTAVVRAIFKTGVQWK